MVRIPLRQDEGLSTLVQVAKAGPRSEVPASLARRALEENLGSADIRTEGKTRRGQDDDREHEASEIEEPFVSRCFPPPKIAR